MKFAERLKVSACLPLFFEYSMVKQFIQLWSSEHSLHTIHSPMVAVLIRAFFPCGNVVSRSVATLAVSGSISSSVWRPSKSHSSPAPLSVACFVSCLFPCGRMRTMTLLYLKSLHSSRCRPSTVCSTAFRTSRLLHPPGINGGPTPFGSMKPARGHIKCFSCAAQHGG